MLEIIENYWNYYFWQQQWGCFLFLTGRPRSGSSQVLWSLIWSYAAVISQMVDSNVVRHRAICCISTVPEAVTVFIDPKQTMHMAKCELAPSSFLFQGKKQNKNCGLSVVGCSVEMLLWNVVQTDYHHFHVLTRSWAWFQLLQYIQSNKVCLGPVLLPQDSGLQVDFLSALIRWHVLNVAGEKCTFWLWRAGKMNECVAPFFDGGCLLMVEHHAAVSVVVLSPFGSVYIWSNCL